ncbi:MAG: SO_0444 family Cu/Zn efflux transporter [Deltaproteobacteria bacterium]|nr:SO_0444 family Cu/Zn efflux transporter [Deltaproteobacteria bacterium]
MDFLLQIFMETVRIFNEAAIYILFGFFIAGVLHSLITPKLIVKYLGKRNFRSVLLASLFGVPLPLCSCSVLPTAISLRKQGASRGSTVSFLISTPETGADSISLTYALMDPLMTVFRPLAAVITAISAGLTANFVDRKKEGEDHTSGTVQAALMEMEHFKGHEHCSDPTCGPSCDGSGPTPSPEGFRGKLKTLFDYAYGELLDDIAVWLLISIVLAGVISALVPPSFFEAYMDNTLLSMLLMLVVGVPLYMCAASSTPLAVALILKGLNPGAALVFLLAGPATNAGTVLLVGKFLGKRMLAVYLGTIAVVSILLGLVLNYIYLKFNLDPAVTMGSAAGLIPQWLKIGASIVLMFLILKRFRGYTPETLRLDVQHRIRDLIGRDITLKAQFFNAIWAMGRWCVKFSPAIIAFGYLLSGFYTIQPGETGLLERFGKVTGQDIPPGLHYRLPYPIETVNINKISEIRRTEIGFRSNGDPVSMAAENRSILVESESLTGDENIVNILFAIQHRIKNFFDYRYKVDNQDNLVKVMSESIIRHVLGKLDIDTILTGGRADIEKKIQRQLQADLDRYEAGIRIVDISILNDHAPVNVHQAFRDVASAEEDKSKRINQAYAYRNATLANARGNAVKIIEEAKSYKEKKINRAVGEADNFTQQAAAYQGVESVTRIRLYLETMEESLSTVNKFIKPPKGTVRAIDLWFQGKAKPAEQKGMYIPGMNASE